MKVEELINKSHYGTVGYIASTNDLDVLESYIVYNFEHLNKFKQIIVATNYCNTSNLELKIANTNLWKKYFNNVEIVDLDINRGHNHGYTDLDNAIFDYCKENNVEWLCKSANDTIFNELFLDIDIDDADFYYTNGISYETLLLNNFDYKKIYDTHFYPQTNCYFINVSNCDYLNDKNYLNETYHTIENIANYNGKIWEYIDGWSCENFLKNCVERNNLKKFYILTKEQHIKLCEAINQYKIGDPSHKNIFVNGVCHFQFPDQPVIEI